MRIFVSMFHVYIIYSKKLHKFYKGFTRNLRSRLARHNHGKVISTKHGTPWLLIWSAPKPTIIQARAFEKKLKNLSQQRTIEFMVKHFDGVRDFKLLGHFAVKLIQHHHPDIYHQGHSSIPTFIVGDRRESSGAIPPRQYRRGSLGIVSAYLFISAYLDSSGPTLVRQCLPLFVSAYPYSSVPTLIRQCLP